jgi:hypothetical protein
MNRAIFPAVTITLSALVFAGVWTMTDPARASVRIAAVTGHVAEPAAAAPTSVYYPGCNAVRAAGAAPLYRDQPGYRLEMDGDGDGIACEPHPDI